MTNLPSFVEAKMSRSYGLRWYALVFLWVTSAVIVGVFLECVKVEKLVMGKVIKLREAKKNDTKQREIVNT